VRASDAERERVVSDLRDHCAAGRLTLEEFSQRVDEAYSAKTRGELAHVTRELPAASTQAPDRPRRKARRFLVSIMGGLDRRGRWRVRERTTVVAFMGGSDLDLRQAQLEGDEVTITIVGVMAGVDLYVPEGIEVDVGGFSLMGGIDEWGEDPPPRPGTPLIRVRAFALMGGIDVWHVPPGSGASFRELRRAVRTSKRPR
jgi:hypothetical protein